MELELDMELDLEMMEIQDKDNELMYVQVESSQIKSSQGVGHCRCTVYTRGRLNRLPQPH